MTQRRADQPRTRADFLHAQGVLVIVREPPAALVSGILDTTLEPISPETDVATVARYFATYNLVSLPVVDADDHLLGAVTVDDLIDHMLPEDWRDTGSAS